MFTPSCVVVDLGFTSESELLKYITMGGSIFGAIVFDKSDWLILPKKLCYKIRLGSEKSESQLGYITMVNWKTNDVFPEMPTPGPRNDTWTGSIIIEEN